MADDLAIDVRGMTKRFGRLTAVDGIDLQVRAGEICGFLGPNGSGKTTFIRMLCGLLRPDAGSGTCLGHDVITGSDAIKREVGYMTQRFSFWEDLHELAGRGLTFLIATHYMDEAERCHRLAYILDGRLLAHGTAAQVIEEAHLTTWSVSGPRLLELAGKLRSQPGVRQAVAF